MNKLTPLLLSIVFETVFLKIGLQLLVRIAIHVPDSVYNEETLFYELKAVKHSHDEYPMTKFVKVGR